MPMQNELGQLAKHRDTGLAMTLILGILTLVFKNQLFAFGLMVTLVLTMVNPRWCFFITPLWFGFSHILGTIISKVIFSAIFLLIATPVGLFRKLLKRDSMNLKLWKNGTKTAMISRNHTYIADDLKTPY